MFERFPANLNNLLYICYQHAITETRTHDIIKTRFMNWRSFSPEKMIQLAFAPIALLIFHWLVPHSNKILFISLHTYAIIPLISLFNKAQTFNSIFFLNCSYSHPQSYCLPKYDLIPTHHIRKIDESIICSTVNATFFLNHAVVAG